MNIIIINYSNDIEITSIRSWLIEHVGPRCDPDNTKYDTVETTEVETGEQMDNDIYIGKLAYENNKVYQRKWRTDGVGWHVDEVLTCTPDADILKNRILRISIDDTTLAVTCKLAAPWFNKCEPLDL
jgi:hypothetical protein